MHEPDSFDKAVSTSQAPSAASEQAERPVVADVSTEQDDARFDDLIDAALKKIQAGERMTKHEANAYFASSLINPTNQVFFRAGLIACREYMARFVEPESPTIAASIRANWWPQLGEDCGPPRQLRWEELTDGGDEGPWTLRPDITPTLEALPKARQFLGWQPALAKGADCGMGTDDGCEAAEGAPGMGDGQVQKKDGAS